jgi:hypothetical protein
MKYWIVALGVTLAGCGQAMSPIEPAQPPVAKYSLLQERSPWEPVRLESPRANSSVENFNPYRAVDGSTDTEWASERNRNSAALRVELAGRGSTYVDKVRIKTGAARGSTYQIETSDDGYNWSPAGYRFGFDDWQQHDIDVGRWARFLRVVWRNTGSDQYASIFDLKVFGNNDRYSGGGGGYGDRDRRGRGDRRRR